MQNHGAIRLTFLACVFLCSCDDAELQHIYLGPPGSTPTYVAVQVERGDVDGDIWRIRSVVDLEGRSSEAWLPRTAPSEPLKFPVTFNIRAQGARGRATVTVQALDAEDLAVGLAQGGADVHEGSGVQLNLTLHPRCRDDAECASGDPCAPRTCAGGMCVAASACPVSSCAEVTCVQQEPHCQYVLHHERCASHSVDSYCDPFLGCLPGHACEQDAECPQDGWACNGREVCRDHHCESVGDPMVDDGNPCTQDACAEPDGPVHFPVADGRDCNGGICVHGLCAESLCGDGVVDPSRQEECDDGPLNSDLAPGACRLSCQSAHCGDGVADPGEECDDGAPSDHCLPGCMLNTCGDGVMDRTAEECDDGNARNDDDCLVTCQLNVCGDGFLNRGEEECDDGNTFNADGCLSHCVWNVCGDHIRDPAREACDDGNTRDGDGCRGDCSKTEACGDGVRDQGEPCDDGNINPNDGCDGCRETLWTAQALLGFSDPVSLAVRVPLGIAVSPLGDAFVADAGSHRILRMERDGHGGHWVTAYAGTGTAGYSGDGSLAVSAQLNNPTAVALDGVGNLFVADWLNGRVRKVDKEGRITTVAGGGDSTVDGDLALRMALWSPLVITLDRRGDLYVSESVAGGPSRVARVDSRGVFRVVAGTWDPNATLTATHGPALQQRLGFITGMALDGDGNLFLADLSPPAPVGSPAPPPGGLVYKVTPQGELYLHAGGWDEQTGEGGPALGHSLHGAQSVASDYVGNLLIGTPGRVWRMNVAGALWSVVGAGSTGYSGDGDLATAAHLNGVWALAQEETPHGTLIWVADAGNSRVRRVELDGRIRTVLGNGQQGNVGDGNLGTSARLDLVGGVLARDDGIYLADDGNGRIRRLAPDGVISLVAGTGVTEEALVPPCATGVALDSPLLPVTLARGNGTSMLVVTRKCILRWDVDGVWRTAAEAQGTFGVAEDEDGSIYYTLGDRIWRHPPDGGADEVFAGGGTFQVAEGLARDQVRFVLLIGLVRKDRALLVSDYLGAQVVGVDLDASARVHPVAGTGTHGFNGDAQLAVTARLNHPGYLAADAVGNVYIADSHNHRVRRVDTTGVITTVAGGGAVIRDGANPTDLALTEPMGITVDAQGALWFSDLGVSGPDDLVWRVDGAGAKVMAGAFRASGDGPLEHAFLNGPNALLFQGSRILTSDSLSGFLRMVEVSQGQVTTFLGQRYGTTVLAGSPKNLAPLQHPLGLAWDPSSGILFVSERDQHRIIGIQSVGQEGSFQVLPMAIGVAGEPGFTGGALQHARLDTPAGLALDPVRHALYVTELGNHSVRRILYQGAPQPLDEVTTVAGGLGIQGFDGDGGRAWDARLNVPQAVAVGPDGSLYIADTGNHRVRRVDPSGMMDTVLGDGTPDSTGDGQPASGFQVESPGGLAVDAYGNLFVTSRRAVRVVAAGADGVATGEDPVFTIYGAPGTPFPATATHCMTGLALSDDERRLVISDECLGALIQLERHP